LFVRAHCNPDVAGEEAQSAVYTNASPSSNFSFSSPAQANRPVNFTDTSSPQATSWLWLYDDGGTNTTQSPSHTFAQAGTHSVALIATNGSGSSVKVQSVPVGAATSGAQPARVLRGFEAVEADRWRLADVRLDGPGASRLAIRACEPGETIVYLRFLDASGDLVLERRLSVAAGQEAINDIGAYGFEGTYALELVSSHGFAATLSVADEIRDERPPMFPERP